MYVEAHSDLRDHPKTLRAARILGISRPQLIGHLLCLWWWAQAYAPVDGDLSAFDAADLADAAEWAGDPETFVNALVACGRGGGGFLDDRGGGLRINDWEDYGGKVHTKRSQGAERARRFREKRSDPAPGPVPGAAVPAAVPAAAQPDGDGITHSNALRGVTVTHGNALETRIDIDIDIDPNKDIDLSSSALQTSGAGAPGADAGAVPPLSLQFREITDALRAEGANRPAILRGWYVACFGDAGDLPDYARLGAVARQVGGAGRLAARFLELAARPPSGDVLSYIQAEARNAKAAGRRSSVAAGGPAASADWEIELRAAGADGGAALPALTAPAARVIDGDADLVATIDPSAAWAAGVASLRRAGCTAEGVPVVVVQYTGADRDWFGRKGIVSLRRAVAPVLGAVPLIDLAPVGADGGAM